MIVGIHQPNYLPYLGFFDKMRRSDIFVIYDDAQFNKDDFQHRNKIRIYHGWKWLTVPVGKKNININKIQIKNDIEFSKIKWSYAHLREIKDNYKDTPYYHLYEKELEKIYKRTHDKLIDLNMNLIYFLMDAFNINTKIIFSSNYGFSSKSSEKLVEIIEAAGGDIYLSGPGGRNYLDLALFEKKKVKVEFQDYTYPIYQQRYDGFIPNMSSIDALFNVGKFPDID